MLDEAFIDLLYKSAPLHGVGKVAVPGDILLRPGKPTAEEFEVMKLQTTHGRDTLQRAEQAMEGRDASGFSKLAKEIAFRHHEEWDGSGDPQGLVGEDMPLAGRMMAVADVYDALISRRVYKPPFTHAVTRDILQEGCGSHLDPDMIKAFIAVEEEFRQIALRYADHDEERQTLARG